MVGLSRQMEAPMVTSAECWTTVSVDLVDFYQQRSRQWVSVDTLCMAARREWSVTLHQALTQCKSVSKSRYCWHSSSALPQSTTRWKCDQKSPEWTEAPHEWPGHWWRQGLLVHVEALVVTHQAIYVPSHKCIFISVLLNKYYITYTSRLP